MDNAITVEQIAYHRNGIGGEGFHAVLFWWHGERFLGTVFAEQGRCAVVSLDRMAAHGVTFGENSWRGDAVEKQLRQAIEADRNCRESLNP